jgi:hypothetical protein
MVRLLFSVAAMRFVLVAGVQPIAVKPLSTGPFKHWLVTLFPAYAGAAGSNIPWMKHLNSDLWR